MATEMNERMGLEAPPTVEIVAAWLGEFEKSLAAADVAAATALFSEDGSWRDLVALSWHIRSFHDLAGIEEGLQEAVDAGNVPKNFQIDPRVEPQQCERGNNRSVIEAYITFDVSAGRGNGVLRLMATDEGHRAWTLMTALREIEGHEPRVGPNRPPVSEFSEGFGGRPWAEKRAAVLRYEDSDPAVLIAGAGQAGLALAARLRAVGIDTLIVDRHQKVGDNWRSRYESLKLHTEAPVNHLPFMPYPESTVQFITKDQYGDWLESYAKAMELKVWTATELVSAAYGEEEGRWTVRLRDGSNTGRTLHPRHLVLATGLSDIPNMPAIEGVMDFRGEAVHSAEFSTGERYAGRKALVFGGGTSGIDIAHDLCKHGASVTLIQRGPMTIINLDPTALQQFALFSSGLPLDICDLLNQSNPYPALIESNKALTNLFREMDEELIEGLEKAGFKTHYGHDETGHFIQYQRSGGGYYLNVGGAELIISGEIPVRQFDEFTRFTTDGLQTHSGEKVEADLAVFATGWKSPTVTLERIFGKEVAERIGTLWGYDEDGELSNMYKRTNQPGAWFIAGGIPEARSYSLYTALQIQACELGLIPARLPRPAARPAEPVIA